MHRTRVLACFLLAIPVVVASVMATPQQGTPRPQLRDLSESGEALLFTRDDGQPGIGIDFGPAARWDVLDFEVRGASVGQPLVFRLPPGTPDLQPALTTGAFHWQPVHLLPRSASGELMFAVFPRRERVVVRLAPPRHGTADAPYYTYSRFESYLAEISSHDLVQLEQIGTSIQGRPLYRIVIDGAPWRDKKTVLMAVRQHGNEDGSSYVLEGVLDLLLSRNGQTPEPALLQRVRWLIYPLVNPDGAVARARGNANGVDLNRDWERGGCQDRQQRETLLHQCDIEGQHAAHGIAIAGDHHGWGSSNHGGFRYSQGQSVSFVSAPEYQEAAKDTTVITRHDPTQFAWQENGGTAGMLRAELFLRFGFLIHTPEYTSSLSTEQEFHEKGRAWARAMLDTLHAPKFTDASGTVRRTAHVPDQLYVTVDDDDENLAARRAEIVQVTVFDPLTGDTETLELAETGPDTGVFRNSTPLPVALLPATPRNGILESVPGHTVIARYQDDDYPRDTSGTRLLLVHRRDL